MIMAFDLKTKFQMCEFRCLMNKRGHSIKRNCRSANAVPRTGCAPYLVTVENLKHYKKLNEIKQGLAKVVSTRSVRPETEKVLTTKL